MSKKYTLDNLVNEDLIYLIGINSSLDSYTLVFKLNKELSLNFVRSKKDIDLPKENAYYNRFIAKNKSKEILYDFFSPCFIFLNNSATFKAAASNSLLHLFSS